MIKYFWVRANNYVISFLILFEYYQNLIKFEL
jgi:hypothetical protein